MRGTLVWVLVDFCAIVLKDLLGFDPEGKGQLKKLLGTRKWIGTADIWVAFSSRGIPLVCHFGMQVGMTLIDALSLLKIRVG